MKWIKINDFMIPLNKKFCLEEDDNRMYLYFGKLEKYLLIDLGPVTKCFEELYEKLKSDVKKMGLDFDDFVIQTGWKVTNAHIKPNQSVDNIREKVKGIIYDVLKSRSEIFFDIDDKLQSLVHDYNSKDEIGPYLLDTYKDYLSMVSKIGESEEEFYKRLNKKKGDLREFDSKEEVKEYLKNKNRP